MTVDVCSQSAPRIGSAPAQTRKGPPSELADSRGTSSARGPPEQWSSLKGRSRVKGGLDLPFAVRGEPPAVLGHPHQHAAPPVQVHADDLPSYAVSIGASLPWWRRILGDFQHPPVSGRLRPFIASRVVAGMTCSAVTGRAGGSPSETFGDLRHHGGRILEENRLRSPVASSTRRSFTRGARTSTGPAAVTMVRGRWWPLRTTSRRPAWSVSAPARLCTG